MKRFEEGGSFLKCAETLLAPREAFRNVQNRRGDSLMLLHISEPTSRENEQQQDIRLRSLSLLHSFHS